MNEKTYFANKLEAVMFLEIKKERIRKLFNVEVSGEVYLPIKSDKLLDRVKDVQKSEEIPVASFVEGMFYVLGIDDQFKYNYIYKEILASLSSSITFIKNTIFELVKKEDFEEAYILLKGLIQLEFNEENINRLILLANNIKLKDKTFKDEFLYVIDKAKSFENNSLPYLYEAILKREAEDFQGALNSINMYLSKGGERTIEVTEFIHSLKNIVNYELGKELLYEDAGEALKLLLPLLDEYGDNAPLYYFIAVGYRILENYEKAIYYLNEALAIDDALAEVVNELGINYASLGDYDKAVSYLRKAFEATKSIEICTNLVMCYMNSGNLEQARAHLAIAEKLDKNDEIVLELKKILVSEK